MIFYFCPRFLRLCHKLISEKNFCSAKFEKMLDNISCRCYNFLQRNGLVAQLGERCVRNAEVKGSNPSRSTKKGTPPERRFSFLQRRGSKRAVVNDVPFGTSEPLDPKASSLRESNPFGEHRLPPVTVS